MTAEKDSIVVIGAGMGGLACAIRLAGAGFGVTVLDAHGWPGGKMRVVDSPAGPVDAGPTVLTMPDILDDLFSAVGESRADHLTLCPLSVLARHHWQDGTQLDLFPDAARNADMIAQVFGRQAAQEFSRFNDETRALFTAFEQPIMRAARPDPVAAARAVLAHKGLLPWLLPGKRLDGMLRARFGDPRLRQLFGRYATYVGGNPLRAPAVLGLIWQAEAAGVYAVQGGMARLARELAGLLQRKGGVLRLNAPVAGIVSDGGRVQGIRLASGEQLAARAVVFNGDPAALPHLLDLRRGLPARYKSRSRSLSARVWTFSATVQPNALGSEALAYHTVFFAQDAQQEFQPLASGQTPHAPTVYVCAQDRADAMPRGPERFQFILNAPPEKRGVTLAKDIECQMHPCQILARFGLHLTPDPAADALTRPADFARLFPHSQGALYGRSPDSSLATFLRPTARTRLPGLYLTGGGVHPGAGVPMALLSGHHAATSLMDDLISASGSRQMAMRGGISTGSAMTANARFR